MPRAEEWAAKLGGLWEERARLASRDMFVASQPGWDDPEQWRKHAMGELDLFLSGLSPEYLATCRVLEIGCGSGRIAELLAPMVKAYSGFDIAPSMVAGAQERCSELASESCRFAVGNGLEPPRESADSTYELILTIAVMIHCPIEVIAANIRSAARCLAPGGELRFQVLADPTCTEGLVGVPKGVSPETDTASEQVNKARKDLLATLTPEERRLTHGAYYMGHRFRYAEVVSFMEEQAPHCRAELYRGDLGAIYGTLKRSR